MAKTIAITNQKGGVGKTTTSINLSASLAATRRRVLLVDIDPQGNATMGSGVDKHDLDKSMFDLLVEDARPDDIMINAEQAGYHLLPANGDLTGAEIYLLEREAPHARLKEALGAVKDRFDYIFIDCPPALNMLSLNALIAADSVIIPMQCEYYALEGLTALLETIEQVRQTHNPGLHIEGLLRTMYDPRNRLATEVAAQLHEHFGDKVYRTPIPRNVRLAEAPSYGLPALYHDRLSSGAKAYLALAGEMIRRESEGVAGTPSDFSVSPS